VTDTWKIKKKSRKVKKNGIFFEGERHEERYPRGGIPDQVLVQTDVASESVDGPEKESGKKVDCEEQNNGEEEEQVGNRCVHEKRYTHELNHFSLPKCWMNYFSLRKSCERVSDGLTVFSSTNRQMI
jgi:hypothetical protein